MRSPAARLVLAALALGALVLSAALLREPPEPYVVTAIDYHFHDAHPTSPIAPGRDLVVKNAGRNTHNVTFEALGVNEDIAPGSALTIEDIADRLDPGRYTFFCHFHIDRGMTGDVVIVGG